MYKAKGKFIRNHSALNSVRFNKNVFNSQKIEQSHLEKKLKQCFLIPKVLSNKTKNGGQLFQKEKNQEISDKDKIQMHKSFYESFRIVNPNGMDLKKLDNIVKENKVNNEKIKAEYEELIDFDELINAGEDFSSQIIMEEKYNHDFLVADKFLMGILKNIWGGQSVSYKENNLFFLKDYKNGSILFKFKLMDNLFILKNFH